ncbi:MAG: hypothetical protein KDC54_12540 [Lewinella sp.]|nr:hypothetical protein [Lewinella sp.]
MLPGDQEQVGEGCTRRRRIAADEQVLLFSGRPFEPGWWKGAALEPAQWNEQRQRQQRDGDQREPS